MTSAVDAPPSLFSPDTSLRNLERGARRVYLPRAPSQAEPGIAEARVLLIDNYDSFTFNLVQFLRQIGATISVVRNDELSVEQILASSATHIVLSPGPGRPQDSGICRDLCRSILAKPTIPLLGVCLGHQVLCEQLGAKVAHSPQILHGKSSNVCHNGHRLFNKIPQTFQAGRYHSLAVQPQTLNAPLSPIAFTEDEILMAVAHENDKIFGVQFHPESILTDHGHQLLLNFLQT